MHRVVALALPKVVAFDLTIPAQVFGDQSERARYDFSVCTERPGAVPTTTGFGIDVTLGLGALRHADTVVVPGYGPLAPPSSRVVKELRVAAERGARIVSVCTGAFALAAAGLLDGRRATTHWQDVEELARRHPSITVDPNVLFVDEGEVLTSAGVAAGIDLCLHILRLDHGAEAASQAARRMVVAPYRDGGQAQFLQRPVPPSGQGLAATCGWALKHLAEPIGVPDLARQAGCSPRTLARHFVEETGTTPLRWLSAQRVLEARRLLETTDLPIERVAADCGLGTAANLRNRLARDANTTPTAYRRTYQGRSR